MSATTSEITVAITQVLALCPDMKEAKHVHTCHILLLCLELYVIK